MCLTPFRVVRDEVSISVPCGKCEKCAARRISGWSFRLMQQDKQSISSYFLTLTYEPERCPITKSGYMDLRKRDLQLFFKRLRKAHESLSSSSLPSHPIKYYACGEYGGKSWRPHYHILLFNAELELMIGKRHADMIKRGTIELDGKWPFKVAQWDNGHVTFGELNPASVGYTMKYISKPKRIPLHRNDDREREFALMSKGIGKDYLSTEIIAYHKADLLNRMVLTTEKGVKLSMPRYYKDKMYTFEERSEIAGHFRGEIEKKVLEETQEQLAKGDESYKQFLNNKKQAVLAAAERQSKIAHEGETI